jgi:Cu-Zn family superoxide dismutase
MTRSLDRQIATCIALSGLLLLPMAQAVTAAAAHADLASASGSSVTGTVAVTATTGGVHLEVKASGLTPGVHGFHVHEVGDCSAPDASSAKGHFNPGAKPHGMHAGDLSDLTADATGAAKLSVDMPGLELGDGPTSIMGRAFVIHADPDDHKTQPSGNSGKRVACGVIKAG